MHRIDTAGNVAGLFANPDPFTGQIPVVLDGDWLNDQQENIVYVITEAGIALVKGDHTQLYNAIQALVAAAAGGVGVISFNTRTGAVTLTSADVVAALAAGSLANLKLANMAPATVKSNLTGGAAAPADNTLAALAASMGLRLRLAANTTFYVSASGNDSNTGLTGGSPWLTIQHALNVLNATYDLGGFVATIQCAAGAYNAPVAISAPFTGGGHVVLQGDTVTPANCTITVTGAASAIAVVGGALTVQGFTLASASFGLKADVGGALSFQQIAFGACADHIHANGKSTITAIGPYSIVGNASGAHAEAFGAHINLAGAAITLTGSPSFATFLVADAIGVVFAQSLTFTGLGTGAAYSADNNGYVDTNGTGASLTGAGFSAGSTGTGGIFS